MQLKTLTLLLLLGACADMTGHLPGAGGDDTTTPPPGPPPPPPPPPTGSEWTAIALPDDGNVERSQNDLVSGIYFSAPDRGIVVSQGAAGTFDDGGAVFTVSGRTAALAFSGKHGGPSLGSVDFTGIEVTPTGYVAMAYSADIVTGDASGHFAIAKDGDLAGVEPVLAFRQTVAGTTLVRDTGVVSVTPDAPGPNASFTDVWAPNASQPVPAIIPPEMCQGGPLGTGVPTTRYSVFIGYGMIAYTAAPSFDPQICISTDGGASFYPSFLDVTGDAQQSAPTGVTFASATIGIAWWGANAEKGYLRRTTDAGKTWTPIALPTSIASHGLALNAAFFAPDGQHGWLVGYDYDTGKALALASTDAGASWVILTTGLGDVQLYSGFALDATHVWLGGTHGTLLVHD